MNPGQRLPANHTDKQCMAQTDNGAAIPIWSTQDVHRDDIEERKGPSQNDVQPNTKCPSAVAIGRKCGSEDQRQVEAGESQTLGDALGDYQSKTGNEAPEDPMSPVNHAACSCFDSRARRSAIVSAVLIKPICVKPCGKLPNVSPVAGSISSPYNPRSFAYCSTRRNSASASSTVPPPSARNSAAQKQQMPNAPSPGLRSSRYR